MHLWFIEAAWFSHYQERRASVDMDAIKDSAFDFDKMMAAARDILSIDETGAHIQLKGVLSIAGPDIFDVLFGYAATSYTDFQEALQEANDELAADLPIYIHADTPGGEVRGAEATARVVREVAAQREVIVLNEGMIASAGVWVTAGATRIEATARTAMVGSIGVMATIVDCTEAREAYGIKIYNFTNEESPDKIIKPGTEHGQELITQRLNALFAVFWDDLTQGRGEKLDGKAVKALKGVVITAEQAIPLGLIDNISGRVVQKTNTPAAMAGNSDGNPEHAVSGKDREEKMESLMEFLNGNPSAKSHFDEMLKKARAEGAEEALKARAADVKKIAAIDTSAYPTRVREACMQVAEGTRSADSALDMVAMFDEMRALQKNGQSDEEQQSMDDTSASDPADPPAGRPEVESAHDRDWNAAINKALNG